MEKNFTGGLAFLDHNYNQLTDNEKVKILESTQNKNATLSDLKQLEPFKVILFHN